MIAVDHITTVIYMGLKGVLPYKKSAVLFISLIILFFEGRVYGQVNVTNHNVGIDIPTGGIFYIPGNYTDNSPAGDGKISLEGTLEIKGHISVASSSLIEPGTLNGLVKISGDGLQNFTFGATQIHIPILEIAKPSSALSLSANSVFVKNEIRFTSGDIFLQGTSLNLDRSASLINERATSRIYGAGTVSISAGALTSGQSQNNLAGLGLSLSTNSGSFFNVTLTRHHQITNFSTFNVANGSTLLKYYSIYLPDNNNAPNFSELTFSYHNPGDVGSLTVAESSVYLSNNGGSIWRRLTGTPDMGSSTISNDNVEMTGSSNNMIVVADRECTVKPGTNIFTSPQRQFVGNVLKGCMGDELTLSIDPANAATYYRWTTPHGTIENADLAIGTLTGSLDLGFYTLYVRNDRGCEDTRTFQLDVLPLPVASFSHIPPNGTSCFGDIVQFDDTSTGVEPGLNIVKWAWDFHDMEVKSSIEDPTHQFSESKRFNVELKVGNQYGCESLNTITTDVFVHPLPIVDFAAVDVETPTYSFCEHEQFPLDNLSSYINISGDSMNDPSLGMTYDWDFGNGVSQVFEPSHIYPVYGQKTIQLTATESLTGCSNSISKQIDVHGRPVPIFHFETSYDSNVDGIGEGVCEGVDITFANESVISDGSSMTYLWAFGDGASSTLEIPVHEYLYSPDEYPVILEATSVEHGCFYSDTLNIKTHPAPQGDFRLEFDEEQITDICAEVEVELFNDSDIASGSMSYFWELGDGTTSDSANPLLTHSFSDPRVHTISLTRTSDENCVNTVQRFLDVHANPAVDFTFENVCDDEPFVFYNSTSIQTDVVAEYEWDFGDLSTSTEVSPVHDYATYGSYDVTLTATSTYDCTSETTKEIEVYQLPSFNIGNLRISCSGSYVIDPEQDTTINAGRHIPPGTSFTWTNNLGQVVGTSPTLEVFTSGVYSARMTTDDPESCETVVSLPVYIVERGDLGTDRTVCQSTVLDGTPASRPNTGVLTYSWQKDGNPLSEAGPSLLVTESGEYTVLVTYSPNSGTMVPSCSYSDVVNISVDETPWLDLGDDLLLCSGEATTITSPETADSYLWENLDTGDVVGSDVSVEVSEAGQYRLTIEKGACSTSDIVAVEALPQPEAGFTTSTVVGCEGEEIDFTNISFSMASSDAIVSQAWDFGDESTSSLVNPSKVYSVAGTYEVILEVQTANGCKDTFLKEIRVDAPPVAAFDVDNGCQGTALGFTNNSTTSATPVSYTWSFGDGSSSNDTSPVHQFEDAGLYDVTLTVSAGGCTTELTKTIEIFEAPEVDFGSIIATCGDQLLLDAGNTGSTFRWYDVPTGSTLGTSQLYTATESREIGLEVTTSNGCVKSDEATLTLNTPVVIDLGSDREVCGPVELDAGNYPNGTYAWSTGSTNRKITVTSSGTYSVSIIDQNGCNASDAVSITVAPQPVVDLGEDITICSGESLVLDAGNSGSNFVWSTGETTRQIVVQEAGLYSVNVTQGSCGAYDEVYVTVLESPEIDFAYEGHCQGDAIDFSAAVSNATGDLEYLWAFGDGTQSASTHPSKTFAVAGEYTVSLNATNVDGCSAIVSKTVSISPTPLPNFSFKNVCEASEVPLVNTTSYSASSEDLSYAWDFGNGSSSSQKLPAYSYSEAGTYLIRLTATTEAQCERTQTKEITVRPTPVVDLGDIIETCEATVLLDAGNAGSTYKWQDNSGSRSFLATKNGDYSVAVTAANGCSASDKVEVVLLESERPNLGEDIEACGTIKLNPGVAAASYLWSTGESTPVITVAQSGTYWVETVSPDLCIHRDSINVIVYALPVISLGPDIAICQGDDLVLNAAFELATSYRWSTGSQEAAIKVVQSGVYGVTLTTAKGCEFTEEISVTVNALPPLDFAATYEACESLLLEVDNIRSTFLWSTGGVGRSVKVEESGAYWLKITDRNGCVSADTTEVTIRPAPELDLGPDVALCFGETVQLDAQAHTAYLWNDLSDGRFKEAGATGRYSVRVTNEFGCEASDDIHVTIKPSLGLSLPAESTICSPGDFLLDAGVDNVSYAWTSNTGFSSSDKIIYPKSGGQYAITVLASDGCTETDVVEVKETTQTIEASFLIPSDVSQDEEVHFVQLTDPEPLEWKWSFGNGFSSVRHSPTYIYYQPGQYTVSLTVSNGVCSDTETKLLNVLEARPAEAAPEKVSFLELYKSNLYPNPADDVVKIDLELSDEAPVLIQVFSLNGLKVAEYEFMGIAELVEFSMSGMLPGAYVMAIQAGRISKTIRFIKAF